MFNLNTKYGDVTVFAETVEQEAISQILAMANSPLGENACIKIMPDVHAGKGCTIGTTMRITDKVCPNLVGVDIGCGVDLIKTNIVFSKCLDELDNVIRKHIPYGMSIRSNEIHFNFEELRCWNDIPSNVQERARKSLGTLGGGNHFIEAYEGGYLAVHSGSRNIGLAVAKHYQSLAENLTEKNNRKVYNEMLNRVEPACREEWKKHNMIVVPKDLCYLTGEAMYDYLHDIGIIQRFANENRFIMLSIITNALKGVILEHISSIHNYIDLEANVLRKGAISAKKGEILVIPLNMRDGMLICKGKGKENWNCSAPHGAGRLYSRSKAKELFTVDEYAETMKGIYSTCINSSTLDEAPFAYKDYEEIMRCIEPTVEILERIVPIYNFKAN